MIVTSSAMRFPEILAFLLQGETQAEEMRLGSSATSVLLSNLRLNTDYVITLYPIYSHQTIAPSVISGRTCKCRLSHIIGCSGRYTFLRHFILRLRGDGLN